MTSPDELVTEYLVARAERDRAQSYLDSIQARLVKQMQADQRKTYKWSDGGVNRNLTYVQQYTTIVDEPGLRRALRAKVFDRYTKRVLDRKRMEAAMDAGEIDPMTVSRFVTQRPKTPYLSYTEKETADGEASDR
jgi:hypothetical protein